jgi:predicted NUDIX family phosphoesterase
MSEKVLVIPRSVFENVGVFHGFSPDAGSYLEEFFDLPFAKFIDRAEAEEDPSFKQIIPYCVLVHDGRICVYERGVTGGEKRLAKKASIGIGGHINPVDVTSEDGYFDRAAYENAVTRELREELRIGSNITLRRVAGVINDDSNPVGSVHLGIVEIFMLDGEDVSSNEDAIENCRFVEVDELISSDEIKLEPWSSIVVDHLPDIFDDILDIIPPEDKD